MHMRRPLGVYPGFSSAKAGVSLNICLRFFPQFLICNYYPSMGIREFVFPIQRGLSVMESHDLPSDKGGVSKARL